MIEFQSLARLPLWSNGDNRLLCTGVTVESADVGTFTFAPEKPAYFQDQPGQFVTLILPVERGPAMRTYTLSSSPSRPHTVAMTVKAQAGSIGTRRMFYNLRPGDTIRAIGPKGDFTIEQHHRKSALFLSAGSGVTPSISLTRFLADYLPSATVDFMTCVQTYDDRLFADELEMLSRRMPNLRIAFVVERPDARPMAKVWSTGRIHIAKIAALSPNFLDREIYCCGPEGFMRHVRAILSGASFDMAHYHEESFQGETAAESAFADNGESVCVVFTASGKRVTAAREKTLLQIAREAGLELDTSCGSGLCGICLVRKHFGAVDMKHRGGISDDEIADGYVRACCSRPLGNVEIEA
ncbi:MAG: flavin reductase family protein [Shinella sp.]|uniref:flavin reductase family protein n=1 Tax=Shinella sp. TaxID=1870904 RepID=UPI004035925B